jgi:MFS transporter, PAT family, beta-lactamase induction signal transducer AmpG
MTQKAKLVWRDLADSRVALMLALGFSAGLPLLMVFGTLSVRLREAGVPVTTIGLFSWLALAYSLKFIWSPLVDAFDVPILARLVGRRRAWMMVCQLLVVLGLVGAGLSDPSASIAVTAAFTFLVAFGSATQDVVVDGWRIDAAPIEKQGIMAASYQLGYRLALLAAGAGALYIAEFVDWRIAYFSMAALMAVGFGAALLSPIVDRAPGEGAAKRPARFSFADAVREPIADLYLRKGRVLVPILALVALYRLPDFVAGVMANSLYVDLGFSKVQIASVAKLYGVWIGIVGAFVGGYLVAKIGLLRTMLIGAVASAVSHLLFAWLTTQGAAIEALVVVISVDNFAGSFSGTALVAYMSGLTAAGFSATQYALLSSLYALPGKLIGGISGFVVAAYGYATFFALTATIGIPVIALIVTVGRAPAGGLSPAKAEDAEAAAQVR